MGLEFEWDQAKADSNHKKHGVRFAQAAEVFNDPNAYTFFGEAHSIDEDREITIGRTSVGVVLLVVHTDRDGIMRIISARKATARERRVYQHG